LTNNVLEENKEKGDRILKGLTNDMVLTFIDNTIERHPECQGVLKAVRYRVSLLEENKQK